MEFTNYKIIAYKGVVRGIVVRSPTIIQGFLGGLKNIIGGQIGAFTDMCEQARKHAYDLMVKHATELGANAIIGMRFEGTEISGRGTSATEILCYGTAVVIEPATNNS